MLMLEGGDCAAAQESLGIGTLIGRHDHGCCFPCDLTAADSAPAASISMDWLPRSNLHGLINSVDNSIIETYLNGGQREYPREAITYIGSDNFGTDYLHSIIQSLNDGNRRLTGWQADHLLELTHGRGQANVERGFARLQVLLK